MTKELKALEKIKFYAGDTWINSIEWNTIETALKALEIIKNSFEISKPVGIDIENNKVSFGCLIQKKDLTKEKFELLKEVLL